MASERPGLAGSHRRRLAKDSLAELAGEVARPGYDRDAIGTGIVHLGVGAFMRAHTAVYCDDAIGEAGGDWRIAGVSLRSGGVRDLLAAQDCLYTVCVDDGHAASYRLVGALSSIDVAPENPGIIVGRLAQPEIRLVTMTITEKGYCLDPGSGELDFSNDAIRHDLESPDEPVSAIGLLVAALERRFRDSCPPLSLVSCDNLPGNGARLERAVVAFARERDTGLAQRIEDAIAFPATMVDRIVPATVDDDVTKGAKAIGLRDDALVRTEPFRQWVIQDRFASGRPAWDVAGALFVTDVEPYEAAKLRLLNGAHSTIAWLGCLAGFRYVHEVMRDPAMEKFVRRLMTGEISPVTPEPGGMRHAQYVEALLERFRNASLAHKTSQIAMDSSQKLPQRLLATLRLQLERGGPIEGLCLAVASWMRYAQGRDDAGFAIEIIDPLSERFAKVTTADAREAAAGFLSIREIFADDLRDDQRVIEAVAGYLGDLRTLGARATVRRFLVAGAPE